MMTRLSRPRRGNAVEEGAQMSFSSSPFEPPQAPVQSPPSRAPWIILLVLGGAALLVPCVCCGGLLAVGGRGVALAVAERPKVEQVVNDYLQKMEDKDVAGAYLLFSPTAKRTVPQSKVQEMIEGPNYALFSDFERATITNIQVMTSPTRTVANVQGTVTYRGGVSGTFRGVVGREGDAWMIDGMHVTVPPAKLAPAKSE
jgi:hypothetical protein